MFKLELCEGMKVLKNTDNLMGRSISQIRQLTGGLLSPMHCGVVGVMHTSYLIIITILFQNISS